MHIADGFLSTPVWIIAYIIAILFIALAIKWSKENLDEKYTPLLAVLAAGIFAIMSFNLPVPFGSSGHLLGAALVAIIFCSPYAAILVLAIVLIIQALFFGDGGITALGANILNMGVVGGFVGYYGFTTLKNIIGKYPSIFISSWAACFIAAVVAALELAISGKFPLMEGIMFMGGYHAMIGVIEAAITVIIIKGIESVRPDLLSYNRGGK
ncbi:MAG: cobalt transporter CbiM [Methanosphaera sp.]|uniref:cobalt transporter CbiM n=1 Tax=Methanosphaera sp. TaxID=2666342 RepID=UPI0025D500EC|nr:cobalt transporter CbiM [Methanosphaera sp.]MCI5867820.1 cobalt transporter CbiM [Methanosphaera sp.]MDD6534830.1 cobalt transporter CbiM [Methanosphaera sp.]MDY3955290.1 cobalt transporter CbiM [Methanosphaera sp.]